MNAIYVDQTIVYPTAVLKNTIEQATEHTDDSTDVTTPVHARKGRSSVKALTDILQQDGLQPQTRSAAFHGGAADGVERYYQTTFCHEK